MIQTIQDTRFAQALVPATSKFRQREGLVQPVSQVNLRVLRDGDREPFEIARETVLGWMARRAGKPLPDEARSGESFTMDDIGAQRTEAIAIQVPRYWAARLDDADKTIAFHLPTYDSEYFRCNFGVHFNCLCCFSPR